MDKLEKSVRSCLTEYGSDLRHGKYTYSGFSGEEAEGYRGQISKAVADIKSGICYKITIYTFGMNMVREHYIGGGIDITDIIENIAKYYPEYSWDQAVKDICDVIKNNV